MKRHGWLLVPLVALVAAPGVAHGASTYCGHVRFEEPSASFALYVRVRGTTCRRARIVARGAIFGQDAAPPFGWRCTEASSETVSCRKGDARIYGARLRGDLP